MLVCVHVQAGSLVVEDLQSCNEALSMPDGSQSHYEALERDLNAYTSLLRLLLNATCNRLDAAKTKETQQQQQQQQQQEQEPPAPNPAPSYPPGSASPSDCSSPQRASSAHAAQLQDAAVLAISACRLLCSAPLLVSRIQQQRCACAHAMPCYHCCCACSSRPSQFMASFHCQIL